MLGANAENREALEQFNRGDPNNGGRRAGQKGSCENSGGLP